MKTNRSTIKFSTQGYTDTNNMTNVCNNTVRRLLILNKKSYFMFLGFCYLFAVVRFFLPILYQRFKFWYRDNLVAHKNSDKIVVAFVCRWLNSIMTNGHNSVTMNICSLEGLKNESLYQVLI